MTKLLPEEHRPLAEYIYSICAVTLDQSKSYLIEGRLGRLVEETGCGSFSGLVQRAKFEPSRALQRRIIDAITTNETFFFRTPHPSICCETRWFRIWWTAGPEPAPRESASGAPPALPVRRSTASPS